MPNNSNLKKTVTINDIIACDAAKEILERRLTEDYYDGGQIHFERCVIKEGKTYLGFIHFFGIGDDGELLLDVQLDKDPYNLYTMYLDNKLIVGSKMYKVFSELEIVDCDGNADIGDLNYRNVRVTLKRTTDGELVVDTLEKGYNHQTETFDVEDFLSGENVYEDEEV